MKNHNCGYFEHHHDIDSINISHHTTFKGIVELGLRNADNLPAPFSYKVILDLKEFPHCLYTGENFHHLLYAVEFLNKKPLN